MSDQNVLGKETVTLWGVKVSPYVRKVMVALAEKKISYQQKEILPKMLLIATKQEVPEDFERISPLRKIPVLQHDHFAIADSAVICAYLDKKFASGVKLYSENPEEFAKALWFERYADQVLTSIGYTKIFLECVVKPAVLNIPADTAIVEKAKQHELPPILNYLENNLANDEWIAGSMFSIADIAIGAQLLALKMAGVEINQTTWPKLSRYFEKICSRPSFKEFV